MSLLVSENIEATHQSFIDSGVDVGESIINSGRPADHGEIKGEAKFKWFQFMQPVLEKDMVAVMQHMTPELIFQPTRYQHNNEVFAMEAFYVHMDDRTADTFVQLSDHMHGDFDDSNAIKKMYAVDADELSKQLDIQLDKDRSAYVGLTFLTKNLESVKRFVESSGYGFRTLEDSIVVDTAKEMNLFLEFKQQK